MRSSEFATSEAAAPAPHAARTSAFELKRVLAFMAVYLIWGSTYLAIRVGVRDVPPLLLAGARFVTAGAIMFAMGKLSGARNPTFAEWQRATFAGIVMLGGGNGLVTWAETRVPSNLAALLIASVPGFVVLMDWLRPGGVRPHPRALGGVLVGALGMALLLEPGPAAFVPGHGLAIAALLGAAASWALGSLFTRYRPSHPNTTIAGAQQMLAGGAALMLSSLASGELELFSLEQVSVDGWLAWLYLISFGSMLAFSAFNWLITVTAPAQLATTAYVNPVVAVVLGYLVLGETLRPVSLAGAGVIICAVAIMVTAPRPSLPVS